MDEFVTPDSREKEESGERPDVKLIQHMGELGIQHMRLGPGKHLHGVKLPAGVKGEECVLCLACTEIY